MTLRSTAAALLLCVAPAGFGAPPETTRNVVITIDHTKSGSIILVDSKRVRDPLTAFSELPADKPILLLVHWRTPIADVWDVLGMLSKAARPEPRIFVFTKDKGTMSEVSFGCQMIYSTDLNQLKVAHGGFGCNK